MAKKKKSNSVNAARELESSISPILEINYADPLFSVAAHPTKPILLSGLATGHLYCNTYDGEKLEEAQSARREEISLLEKEAFKKGKISQVNKSVSQTKKKWWTVIEDNTDIPDGRNIVTNWKTKRHKGSCRSVIFDPLENSVGESIYSVGSDHVIKKANTETGKVTGKVILSDHYPNSKDAVTKLAHSTTHLFLLSGTENGHVLVFDSNNLKANELKFKVSQAHDDVINHILPMPAVSAYHYLTLGSTTLSHIDIRKGIITQSDDQSDELLSMCFATDQINENKNDTVLVSHGEGIITIWKNSKNKLMDQLSRIKVNKSASIDAIIPTMNYDDGDQKDSVWCGDSEGLLHRVNYKRGKVVETRVHSAAVGKYGASDEVGILDIDYDYRLISAGMESLKIWSGQTVEDDINSDESESDSDDDSDSDLNGASDNVSFSDLSDKSDPENDDSEGDDSTSYNSSHEVSANEDSDNESDAEKNDNSNDIPAGLKGIVRKKRILPMLNKPAPKKKVLDINKLTKAQSEPVPEPDVEAEEQPKKKQKMKEKKMTTKQLRNLQKHEHGIKKFDDL